MTEQMNEKLGAKAEASVNSGVREVLLREVVSVVCVCGDVRVQGCGFKIYPHMGKVSSVFPSSGTGSWPLLDARIEVSCFPLKVLRLQGLVLFCVLPQNCNIKWSDSTVAIASASLFSCPTKK